MKHLFSFCFLLLLGVSCISTPAQVFIHPDVVPYGVGGDWSLIFNDEFTGDELNAQKWSDCYWWDWQNHGCTNSGNHELQWYQPGNILAADGILHLRAFEESIRAGDGKTYAFTSGMISSGRSREDPLPPGLAFQYGYVEIRAKLPRGQGLWTSFWLLPVNNQNDRSKPEIDMMEMLGHQPQKIYMTFHYQTDADDDAQQSENWVGPDFSADWHIFGLDWQPNMLIWYVDGVERWRYLDAAYIPNEPMYLILNLAVGGDWPAPPDDSTVFPADLQVDYVRVWKRQ